MSGQDTRIDIALATYNGGAFVAEMIDSVVAQDHTNIVLFVSDDGSTDETPDILNSLTIDRPFHILENAVRRGVLRNFESALGATTARYVALCDQDDVWRRDKLSTLLSRLSALETTYGSDTPLLVFSDLEVVDHTLRTIRPSLYAGSQKSPLANRFADFVISNHVPGCAMLVNRALLDLALPFPKIVFHDWWLIQIAALFGQVRYIDQPLVKYRQHGSNAIGLGQPQKNFWAYRLSRLGRPVDFLQTRLAKWDRQAEALCLALRAIRGRFGDRLPTDAHALVDAGLDGAGWRKLHHLLGSARIGEWRADYFGILFHLRRHAELAAPASAGRERRP